MINSNLSLNIKFKTYFLKAKGGQMHQLAPLPGAYDHNAISNISS